jgi:hypothetical protein
MRDIAQLVAAARASARSVLSTNRTHIRTPLPGPWPRGRVRRRLRHATLGPGSSPWAPQQVASTLERKKQRARNTMHSLAYVRDAQARFVQLDGVAEFPFDGAASTPQVLLVKHHEHAVGTEPMPAGELYRVDPRSVARHDLGDLVCVETLGEVVGPPWGRHRRLAPWSALCQRARETVDGLSHQPIRKLPPQLREHHLADGFGTGPKRCPDRARDSALRRTAGPQPRAGAPAAICLLPTAALVPPLDLHSPAATSVVQRGLGPWTAW